MKLISTILALTFLVIDFDSGALRAAAIASNADSTSELIAQNELDAAESRLAPLTLPDSKDAIAFFQLGNLRIKQQRLDDAVNAYEQATRLDPTRPEYFSRYATALGAKIQGADFMSQAMLAPRIRKAFARSVELDANHLAGLIGLTRYYANVPAIAGGSFGKAREFAQRVHALDPFRGEMELGHIAEREGDPATALVHFERSSSLQPANAASHLAVGRILAQLGRTREARQRFEAVLTIDPRHEAAKRAMEKLGAPH